VLERVTKDYVNLVDDDQLLQASIRGMVASLDVFRIADGDDTPRLKISSRALFGRRHRGVDGRKDERLSSLRRSTGAPRGGLGIRYGDVM